MSLENRVSANIGGRISQPKKTLFTSYYERTRQINKF